MKQLKKKKEKGMFDTDDIEEEEVVKKKKEKKTPVNFDNELFGDEPVETFQPKAKKDSLFSGNDISVKKNEIDSFDFDSMLGDVLSNEIKETKIEKKPKKEKKEVKNDGLFDFSDEPVPEKKKEIKGPLGGGLFDEPEVQKKEEKKKEIKGPLGGGLFGEPEMKTEKAKGSTVFDSLDEEKEEGFKNNIISGLQKK